MGGGPPPQAVVEGFVAPYGANRSKKRSLTLTVLERGRRNILVSRGFGYLSFALRDFLFRRLCRASPDWGAAPNPTQSFTVSRSEIDDIVVEVKLSPYPLHSKG